jgi:hypothetical protein
MPWLSYVLISSLTTKDVRRISYRSEYSLQHVCQLLSIIKLSFLAPYRIFAVTPYTNGYISFLATKFI